MPVAAVPLAQAGEVAMWGPLIPSDPNEGQATVPASLAGVAVTQVAMADTITLALTAAGKVVSWGGNGARLERIPDTVKAAQVAQITTSYGSYAGAVTRGGQVLTWGRKTTAASPLDVPAGLSGVKQLALADQNAVALKNDGSVVAWGLTTALNTPPAGLTATAIATGQGAAYALTTSGTVAAWGTNGNGELNLPPEVKLAGNVKAVAALANGAVALLADNSLVSWGTSFDSAGVAWLSSLDPVSIVGNNTDFGVVDREGVLHHRPTFAPQELALPSGLNGRAVANFGVGASGGFGAAVITKMLRGDDPTISGTPTVGSALTATPGTFSASPTSVTGQWLENGKAIPGATGTTLSLTAAQLGKAITYQSTATKAGEATISSTSAAVTVANTPPPPAATVDSKTKVTKVVVAKKAAKVTVTGKVTAAKPVTGKAKVTIKKGKKAIVTKTVNVSSKGAVSLTVKKFGKLVIKKTKPKKGKKGKKATYRGSYTVTIAYAGNADVKASNASKKFKVK